ncbi:MAG TPA: hypothetical protein VI454_06445 [Verrucomicrobiae bacterium]|jgi:hypothetical protein
MTFQKFLENWDMTELELDINFLKMRWVPQTADQNAAWELYVELLTRVTTQALPSEHGDEKTALESIYSLFPTTREIIKKHGKECINFAKIAIPVLNQIVRPFTAKWHGRSLTEAFEEPNRRQEFRQDLAHLQDKLTKYARLLAGMARVEDITSLEAKNVS